MVGGWYREIRRTRMSIMNIMINLDLANIYDTKSINHKSSMDEIKDLHDLHCILWPFRLVLEVKTGCVGSSIFWRVFQLAVDFRK